MLRLANGVLGLAFVVLASSFAGAQAPEIKVAATSPAKLQQVFESFGPQGEGLGLRGAVEFLSYYADLLDNDQPLVGAVAFSSSLPVFSAEFAVKDLQAFMASLNDAGFKLNEAGNQLKNETGLVYHVERIGDRLRLSDNEKFLRSAGNITDYAKTLKGDVQIFIDWRNLNNNQRYAAADKVLSTLEVGSTTGDLSIASLPNLPSLFTRWQTSQLFSQAEQISLQCDVRDDATIGIQASVANRYLAPARTSVPAFAALADDQTSIATAQWSLPIQSAQRNLIQMWAQQFPQVTRQSFSQDEFESQEGSAVIAEGAKILASHVQETINLDRIQSSMAIRLNQGQPVIGIGIRVANAARLNTDLQRLIKEAQNTGAPIASVDLNVPSNQDISLHRIVLPIESENEQLQSLFGDAMTLYVGTAPHALMIGIGEGSSGLLEQMVSGQTSREDVWVDCNVLGNEYIDQLPALREIARKLGINHRNQLQVVPSTEGFRVLATIANQSSIRGRTQLTSETGDASQQDAR